MAAAGEGVWEGQGVAGDEQMALIEADFAPVTAFGQPSVGS